MVDKKIRQKNRKDKKICHPRGERETGSQGGGGWGGGGVWPSKAAESKGQEIWRKNAYFT